MIPFLYKTGQRLTRLDTIVPQDFFRPRYTRFVTLSSGKAGERSILGRNCGNSVRWAGNAHGRFKEQGILAAPG
jgi:hypothetical protein